MKKLTIAYEGGELEEKIAKGLGYACETVLKNIRSIEVVEYQKEIMHQIFLVNRKMICIEFPKNDVSLPLQQCSTEHIANNIRDIFLGTDIEFNEDGCENFRNVIASLLHINTDKPNKNKQTILTSENEIHDFFDKHVKTGKHLDELKQSKFIFINLPDDESGFRYPINVVKKILIWVDILLAMEDIDFPTIHLYSNNRDLEVPELMRRFRDLGGTVGLAKTDEEVQEKQKHIIHDIIVDDSEENEIEKSTDGSKVYIEKIVNEDSISKLNTLEDTLSNIVMNCVKEIPEKRFNDFAEYLSNNRHTYFKKINKKDILMSEKGEIINPFHKEKLDDIIYLKIKKGRYSEKSIDTLLLYLKELRGGKNKDS